MSTTSENPAWISTAMDDAGLSPSAFRVLAHICRRSGDGSNGRGCDASVESMAKICRLDPKTLKRALKELESSGWIVRTFRDGGTSIIRPRFPHPTQSAPGVIGTPPNRHPRFELEADPIQSAPRHPTQSAPPKGKPEGKPKGRKDRATLAELSDYAIGQGFPASDGEELFDYWESVGWVNGKATIRDWQAAFRTRARNGWLASQKRPAPVATEPAGTGKKYDWQSRMRS